MIIQFNSLINIAHINVNDVALKTDKNVYIQYIIAVEYMT